MTATMMTVLMMMLMMKLCNVSLQYLYDCVTVISAFYASAGHYPLEGFHVWPV